MSLFRQSLRTRPPFGELGDPPLPADSKVLYEEEYCRKPIAESHVHRSKPEESFKQKDVKRVLKTSSKNELAYADYHERLLIGRCLSICIVHKEKEGQVFEINLSNIHNSDYIKMLSTDSTVSSDQFLEASINKQRRRQRQVSGLSNTNSCRVDKLLHDGDNDWFFEKILEKFDDIRSKRTRGLSRCSSTNLGNNSIYGVERIIERRYYVKKLPSLPKRDQLTSTTDLTGSGKKNRVLSGVSSATAASLTCSQCSSSTPTFVEDLRDQSTSLRHDISELKDEIEQLQTSQREFFQQIRSEFHSKPIFQPTTQTSGKNETIGNRSLLPNTNQRSRSVSTESNASTTTATSRTITPTPQTIAKPAPAPPAAPPMGISEFVGYKNPTIASSQPVNAPVGFKPPSVSSTPATQTYQNSKPASISSTPATQTYQNSKPLSIPSTPAANTHLSSKPSSIAPTPPNNPHLSSKASSVASTPPINPYANGKPLSMPTLSPVAELDGIKKPPIASPLSEFMDSRRSSIAPTPPRAPSPIPSRQMPIYENEVAYRRTLSPRSQIVASSASIAESSTSSSRSTSPSSIQGNSQSIPKAGTSTLRADDLQDLAQYSSNLELSGFAPSTAHVVSDPNTSSTFWDSVDHFIGDSMSTNAALGLPSIPQSYYGNSFGLDNNTSRQLNKYDLEIKPQETLIPSAPLLMPSYDTSL